MNKSEGSSVCCVSKNGFHDSVFSLIEDWDSGFYWRTAIFAIITWDRRQNYKEEEGWDTMGF